MQDLVFVCTGNICRSPMAEFLFRNLFQSEHPDWRVCSAGVSTSYGIPASRFAIQALDECGVDLTPHRSQPVIPQMASTAALLVVMTRGHQAYLQDMYPIAGDKTSLLLQYSPKATDVDLLDPIGLSFDVYRYVRDEIREALKGLSEHLHGYGANASSG